MAGDISLVIGPGLARVWLSDAVDGFGGDDGWTDTRASVNESQPIGNAQCRSQHAWRRGSRLAALQLIDRGAGCFELLFAGFRLCQYLSLSDGLYYCSWV